MNKTIFRPSLTLRQEITNGLLKEEWFRAKKRFEAVKEDLYATAAFLLCLVVIFFLWAAILVPPAL